MSVHHRSALPTAVRARVVTRRLSWRGQIPATCTVPSTAKRRTCSSSSGAATAATTSTQRTSCPSVRSPGGLCAPRLASPHSVPCARALHVDHAGAERHAADQACEPRRRDAPAPDVPVRWVGRVGAAERPARAGRPYVRAHAWLLCMWVATGHADSTLPSLGPRPMLARTPTQPRRRGTRSRPPTRTPGRAAARAQPSASPRTRSSCSAALVRPAPATTTSSSFRSKVRGC